ncbi:MAG: hypothetical protein K0R51_685 [Cytophagaceae bacterium]|jgi:secreted PhoX family phosphatase|nr:hypothetical protein [Cytophagaceae bacterium]
MKRFYTTLMMACAVASAQAQTDGFLFDVEIDVNYAQKSVHVPASPFESQVLFIGGVDNVQTVDANGEPNGEATAKQWHDFIGFTPDNSGSGDLGWVTINHEMIAADAKIGDGGGMTVFKVRKAVDGTLEVVTQTLADGRTGEFFNVDFKNTTGETGMNCGGIVGPDGRIWTAEEWYQGSNAAISGGVTDLNDFTIGTTTPNGFPGFNGTTIAKFQNFNWMTEIDPKEAKAIRKQYNWGKAGYEGGAIADDGTVYLGEDGTPGLFTKFVPANASALPIDYTQGQLYVYKHDATGPQGPWVAVDNTDLDNMLNLSYAAGASNTVSSALAPSIFDRLEWVAINKNTGKVYITETGVDGLNLTTPVSEGFVIDPHFVTAYKNFYKQKFGAEFPGTDAAALDSVRTGKFNDYYGRVLEYDPATGVVKSFLEGGPYFSASPSSAAYPEKHLTNPDGLAFLYVNGKTFMVIEEDLNGRTFGRMPAEFSGGNQTVCEMFLLDMSIESPTVDDLVKIAACAPGGEITGLAVMDDGNTILFNNQHPDTGNDYPYNNSVTVAVTGFKQAVVTGLFDRPKFDDDDKFSIWPNPASRELKLNKVTDVAIYDNTGMRISVSRNTDVIDISMLRSGIYYIQNAEGLTKKLVVE